MFGIDREAHITPADPNQSGPIRALCIHGHFYQPPREDPLTGEIPDEIGSEPYRNWNERIHAECYRPNAELGNFERISFNIGPTLIGWMAQHDPITYQRILAQDRSNLARFGVGNAMAQAYNHTILPLANRRDKETQIYWGVADFRARFGRQPQGMWLPETAADLETLEVLVDHGIQFTILAPWQARSAHLDPTQSYWVNLPSGRRIAVFFYHAGLSAGVSFDQGMTSNAHDFALNRLLSSFNQNGRSGQPQLLMVASDGELYGHHQSFRDWFLAYLVNGAGAKAGIQLTFPALWLSQFAPKETIEIHNQTSWSCHHGVARWAGDCGCIAEPGHWKAYLRQAFDHLSMAIDHIYVDVLAPFGLDPWRLRNAYVQVLLGQASVAEILPLAQQKAGKHEVLLASDLERVAFLLAAQHERQRMYTSCGFFFEDFSRIEPRNNVRFAAQAVRLVEAATGIDLSAQVLADLHRVVSQRTHLRGDQEFSYHLQRARRLLSPS